jgi:hypothetical protein
MLLCQGIWQRKIRRKVNADSKPILDLDQRVVKRISGYRKGHAILRPDEATQHDRQELIRAVADNDVRWI